MIWGRPEFSLRRRASTLGHHKGLDLEDLTQVLNWRFRFKVICTPPITTSSQSTIYRSGTGRAVDKCLSEQIFNGTTSPSRILFSKTTFVYCTSIYLASSRYTLPVISLYIKTWKEQSQKTPNEYFLYQSKVLCIIGDTPILLLQQFYTTSCPLRTKDS